MKLRLSFLVFYKSFGSWEEEKLEDSGGVPQRFEIIQDGDFIKAIKLNTNNFVPEGEVSFWLNTKTKESKLKLSEIGFRNPREVDCSFAVIDQNKIILYYRDIRCVLLKESLTENPVDVPIIHKNAA